MSKRAKAALTLGLLTMGLGSTLGAGCEDWIKENTSSGKFRLFVTDTPFPAEFLEEATVTVTRVDVRRVVDENPSDPADPGLFSPEPVFETHNVFEGEQGFNLVELRNGIVDLLGEAELPVGQYDQVRVVVTGGFARLTDGREFELAVPAEDQAGITLNYTFVVAPGFGGLAGDALDTELLLDIDLSRAFQVQPSGQVIGDVSQITGFDFHPSSAMRLADLNWSGDVTGMVVDSNFNLLGSVLVTVYDEDNQVVAGTVSDPEGSFTILGLPPGTYEVEFTRYLFLDQTIEDVFVTATEVSDLGVVVMLGVE